MKRRFCSAFIVLALCLSLLPGVTVAAAHPFQDVPNGHWATAAVAYVYDNDLMNGTGSGTFTPDGRLTRAMFVTILGRMDGVNAAGYPGTSFSDVPVGQWYSPYVAWASEQRIVTGTGNGNGNGNGCFSPDTSVTREQMAAMIARYVEAGGINLSDAANAPAGFQDASSVSSWAKDGLELMRRTGILTGYADGTFGPKKTATRAEAATIFMRLCRLLDGENPATDPKVLYQEVLAQYKEAKGYGFDFEVVEQKRLQYVNAYAEPVSFATDAIKVYYAFEDIDQNGTSELVIGVSNAHYGEDPFLLDVFTYNGNCAVNPFDGAATSYYFSARNRLSILHTGILANEGSGGAAYAVADYYALGENGYRVQLVEGIYTEPTEYDYETVRCYHRDSNDNTVEITEGEYFQIAQKYEIPKMSLHWVAL